jgi:hypothetical protein
LGVRLFVQDHQGELDAVETATEDDFMYFRDSVHLALEGGKLASRFPILFKTFFSDWQREDVPGLERELREIHAAFRQLPPAPPDGNWRAELGRSGRMPETLAEVHVDGNGAPLLERLIALAQTARENRLPVRWGEADSRPFAGAPESGAGAGLRAAVNGRAEEKPARLSHGDDLLLAAVKAGDLEAARAALAAGASPDATAIARDEDACSSGTPALYAAVNHGNTAMVELLLSNGANPNAVFTRRGIIDFETRTCLIAALPHADIASMLLQAGADPNLPGSWGEDRTTETSPLAHAQGNPAVEGLLRSYGARET